MSIDVRCEDLRAALSAYVDHETSPVESARVEAHVRTCSDCAARLRQLERDAPRMDAQIRGAMSRGESDVQRALRTRRRPLLMQDERPRPHMLGALATGMLLVVGAVLALTVLRSAPASQMVQPATQPTPPPAPLLSPGMQRVLLIQIGGIVDPAVAAYVQRATQTASTRGATLVIELDASGALDTALRDVSDTLGSGQAPVVAYVKQRNAATAAIAQAASYTTETDPGLQTAELLPMDPLEALWHRLLDPSIAYVLFVLGLYALFAEVAHPGAILPGITGVIALGLASFAFTSLPVNWVGVAVIVVGVVLMGVELKAPTHGLLTLAGLAGLVAGSELLYAAPGSLAPMVTELSVAPVVLGGTALVGLAVGLTFARIARRIRALPPIISLEQLVGARGVSRSGLDPDGVVHVQGQLWSARARGPHLGRGEGVRVLARHGLVLEVESAARRSAATQKGAVQ